MARAQGRVGKVTVAKMLCGSRSQQLSKLRLDQLSTFGLLSQLRQSEATEFLDVLIKHKLIQLTETKKFRPTVRLTTRGEGVMKGQLRLDQPLSVPPALHRKLLALSLPSSAALATSARPQPAVETHQPATEGALTGPEGYVDADPAEEEPVHAPDYYWTWRVFAAGCTLEECMRIRHIGARRRAGTALRGGRSGELRPCGLVPDATGAASSGATGGRPARRPGGDPAVRPAGRD